MASQNLWADPRNKYSATGALFALLAAGLYVLAARHFTPTVSGDSVIEFALVLWIVGTVCWLFPVVSFFFVLLVGMVLSGALYDGRMINWPIIAVGCIPFLVPLGLALIGVLPVGGLAAKRKT